MRREQGPHKREAKAARAERLLLCFGHDNGFDTEPTLSLVQSPDALTRSYPRPCPSSCPFLPHDLYPYTRLLAQLLPLFLPQTLPLPLPSPLPLLLLLPLLALTSALALALTMTVTLTLPLPLPLPLTLSMPFVSIHVPALVPYP